MPKLKRMVLVIDNYDSFTYNLVQYLGELQVEMQIHRNDQISIEQIRALQPERILISPGPCSPKESGLSNEIIRHFSSQIPTLGVCLGHQCIGHVFGANVIVNYRMMHGKTSLILPACRRFISRHRLCKPAGNAEQVATIRISSGLRLLRCSRAPTLHIATFSLN